MRTIGKWVESSDEVWSFARDMVTAGFIRDDDVTGLLEYFEKPWHWSEEHDWWVKMGRPDDAATWEQGMDDGWEPKEVRS
jgi:hypothetical protein